MQAAQRKGERGARPPEFMTDETNAIDRRAAFRAAAARAADWCARPRPARTLTAMGFLALALALFAPALGSSNFVYGTDTYSHDYIMHLYGWNTIRETGRIPLWCPYLFFGLPFVGSFALCPFYPSQLLYFVFPHNTAFTLQYALAVWVAAAGFFAWARALGCRRPVALFAGAAFALSGHFLTLSHAGHLQKMIAIAWVPAALLGARGLAPRRNRPPHPPRPGLPAWADDLLPTRRQAEAAILLAFAGAMQLFASHAQVWYATMWLAAMYLLAACGVRAADSARSARRAGADPVVAVLAGRHWARGAGMGALFALAVGGSFVFSAAQSFPGGEMGAVSNRAQGVSFEEAVETSYPPLELFEYAVPRLFGDSSRDSRVPYFGAWGERIVSDYLGPVLLLLAAVGWLRGRGRLRHFLLAAALVSVIVGLGRYTPVYRALYAVLPGFHRFRSPGSFLFVADFALVSLAALGLERLVSRPLAGGLLRRPDGTAGPLRRMNALTGDGWATVFLATVLVAGLAAALYCLTRNWGVNLDIATVEEKRRHHLHHGAMMASLLASLGCALTLLALRNAEGSRGRRAACAMLAVSALLPLAVSSLYFVRFEPLDRFLGFLMEIQPVYTRLDKAPERPLRLLQERQLKSDGVLHGVGVPTGYHPVVLGRYARLAGQLGYASDRFGSLFSILYAHTYSPDPPPGKWKDFGANSGAERIWRWDGDARPYARSNARLAVVPDTENAAAQLAGRGMAADLAAVEPEVIEALGLRPGRQGVAARLDSWEPARVKLSYAAESRGLLPVAEVFAPGWKARTGRGAAVAIVPVNLAQRALVVPAGIGTITMWYDPFSVRLGIFLSLLCGAVAASRLVRGALRRHPRGTVVAPTGPPAE